MKNKEKHHNIDMVTLRIKFHLAYEDNAVKLLISAVEPGYD